MKQYLMAASAALFIAGGTAVPAVADDIFGDNRDNVVRGTAGPDTIRGRRGDDVLLGRGGRDTLFGEGDHDRIDGGDQRDSINGGTAGDQLSGGRGDDELAGHVGGDELVGGPGDDELFDFAVTEFGPDFADDEDTLRAGIGDDHIGLLDGPDRVFAAKGRDVVRLETDGARDLIRCGPGSDRVIYFGSRDRRDTVIACETVRVRR